MRYSRRSQISLRILGLALLVVFSCAGVRARQSDQATSQVSPAWKDAIARLASRIGNLAWTERAVSIEVKNISSLTEAEAASISQELKAELQRLRFSVVPQDSAATQMTVTLSEGVEGYVWVAEIRHGPTLETEMVSAPRNGLPGKGSDTTVSLEQRLVWQQPGRFLDFVVEVKPAFASTVVVIEPNQLTFYRSADFTNWQAVRSIDIPVPSPTLRDPFGLIDEANGNAYVGPAGDVFKPTARCTGGFDDPDRLQCSKWSGERVVPAHPKVPHREQSEKVFLGEDCGGNLVVLATGSNDWTEPDAIQGYLVSGREASAVPSGSELNFAGPVVALQAGSRDDNARAIVHNLKTGNYEGYIVTANCGN